jgi:acyl-CoA thioesterase
MPYLDTRDDARDEPPPSSVSASVFDTDTTVRPVGAGEYAAELSPRWNSAPALPNGGYQLALCTRAMADAVPGYPDPLVVAATFLRPASPGPATIAVETVRAGRTVATAEARLNQNGKEVVRAVATFGDLAAATGPTLERGEPPTLPPPHECTGFTEAAAAFGAAIAEQVEYRVPELPGWLRGEPSGRTEASFWMRFTDGRDADTLSLVALVDAAAPVVADAGHLGSSTIQLTVHVRRRPAPGWLACHAVTRHLIDGYHEEDFEIWDAEGRLVAQGRQFAVVGRR